MSLYNTTNSTNFAVDMADFGMTMTSFRNIQAYVPPRLSIPVTTNNIAGFGDFHNPKIPSNKTEVGAFVLKILMDEHMECYNEMYEWMYTINPYGGKLIDADIHGDVIEKISPEEMFIHYLDNTHRRIVSTHSFSRPFPMDVYIPEYNVTTNVTYPMVMEVTFGFNMFKIYNEYNKLVKSRQKMDDAEFSNQGTNNGPNIITRNLEIGSQKTLEQMIADKGK